MGDSSAFKGTSPFTRHNQLHEDLKSETLQIDRRFHTRRCADGTILPDGC